MRLFEFTNAQEQLALLRVIIDNTWQAIEQQAAQQARAAAQKAASKSKRSSTKKMPNVKMPALQAAKRQVPRAPAAKPAAATPAATAATPTTAVRPVTPTQQAAQLKQQANRQLAGTAQADAEQLAQMGSAR